MSVGKMPRFDGDEQRQRRQTWADSAQPIVCDGCARSFQPTHPRQRFCRQDDCPGRRAPSGPKRPAKASGRQLAALRRVRVQGVLADVLLHVHHGELEGELDEVRTAMRSWVDAERTGRRIEVRAALIRLQAACAMRTLLVAPPLVVDEDPDDPDS